MAVDIKQLRIGSHVEYEGKRVSVDEIQTVRPEGSSIHLLISHNGLVCGNPGIDEVEPIQITPELLTELGFEDYSKCFYGEWEKRWDNEKYMCFSAISDNRWRVHYMDGCMDLGNCVCRYLHEAEAFLALHNVEFLND